MPQVKTIIIVLVTLVIGFVGGFVFRPVIAPAPQTVAVAGPSPVDPAPSEARGTQYFVGNVDEARQVVAGCRDGSRRGGECATAGEAIIKIDAAERRRKFLEN